MTVQSQAHATPGWLKRVLGRTPATSVEPKPLAQTEQEYGYFFLRGRGKSGTNWLCNLLNLHPKILCTGEYYFENMKTLVDGIGGNSHHKERDLMLVARGAAQESFHELVRNTLRATAFSKPGAVLLGDRTPRPIQAILPSSKILYIYRDARDVLVSWTFHVIQHGTYGQFRTLDGCHEDFEKQRNDTSFMRNNPEKLLQSESWVRTISGEWSRMLAEAFDSAEKIERGDLDASVHVVRYETLHADVEGERDRCYRFLGVDPAEAEPISKDNLTVPGFGREEKPSDFYRKGQIGDWKNYFTDEQKRWLKDAAGEALVKYGYEKDLNW